MKLIRKNKTPKDGDYIEAAIKPKYTNVPWKVLIVDDEPDVHAITRLNLKSFDFAEKNLMFLQAMSAREAKEILQREENIAVALVDVVMEEEDAGLKLVEYIRNDLGNKMIRLVIRTGQPGIAPERLVVDRYDIDDYKDKTELTAQKLYTTIRSALKSYRDLSTINTNRIGLRKILDAASNLHQPQSMGQFFDGILIQIIGLCNLGENNLISTISSGLVITSSDKRIEVQAGTGRFANIGDSAETQSEVERIVRTCTDSIEKGIKLEDLPENIVPIPLKLNDKVLGFVCLENANELGKDDRDLIDIMAHQCATALENLRLYVDLKEANRQALHMLAVAAEYKDKDTGDHINRLARYTVQLSTELGLSKQEADNFGISSMLHDIGKIGIPDAILQKPGKLTKEEFDEMKTHPVLGTEILGKNKWFSTAYNISYGHHERWDGNGYPQGIPAVDTPLEARIVAVADVFDALTHKRCYKEAWPVDKSLAVIQEDAGKHFDPEVVDALIRLHERGELKL
ncbi:MAG: HD domain-containing phosphohydrolase [Thiotrichaceae bacterium]|nr:HD domain-containing phosphohydrolase [Thiotrichaceae bacterium]